MGGAIYYSIYKAEKKEEQAKNFIAGALWVLMISSVLVTILAFLLNGTLLRLLGAGGGLLALGEEYIAVIALGASTQVIGTICTNFSGIPINQGLSASQTVQNIAKTL